MAVRPVDLREAVSTVVWGLSSYTHTELTSLGKKHRLPIPGEEAGTKSQRLEACLEAITDGDLHQVAQRLLDSSHISLHGADRFALEDAVWEAGPVIEIMGRTRRDIAHAIDLEELIHRQDRFEGLLEQFWVLDNDPMATWSGSSSTSRRALIHRFVFRNPGDWSTDDFFEQLGAYEAGSARFGRFLEGLVDPGTLPDAEAQSRVVEAVNVVLVKAGARLEQTGDRDGYPYFQLVRTGPGAVRRPKTLVFATTVKPDIRLVSVVDNDIEVLQDMDQILVYDRPVGPEGIRWRNLQQWWQEKKGIDDEGEAKKTLYERLLKSMPADEVSPQRNFYRIYHENYGVLARDLPALLPEVWLHWDHKTVRQRGVKALLNHRMDFLMLLPHGHRVVLEVDGGHHYATSRAYEGTVRGDRDLKLRGYETYRFSSTELGRDQIGPLMKRFFAGLFDLHGLVRTESESPSQSS